MNPINALTIAISITSVALFAILSIRNCNNDDRADYLCFPQQAVINGHSDKEKYKFIVVCKIDAGYEIREEKP